MAQLPRVHNFFWCMTLYVGSVVIGVFEVLQGLRCFFYEGGRPYRGLWLPLFGFDSTKIKDLAIKPEI